VVALVCVCYGDVVAMVPATNGEWLAERLPRATLSIQSEAGHSEICFGSGEHLFAAVDGPISRAESRTAAPGPLAYVPFEHSLGR
jgi:hypothetical protein